MRAPGRISRAAWRSWRKVSGGGQACGAVCSHLPRSLMATPRETNAVTAHGSSRHSMRANPTMASVPPGRTSWLSRPSAARASGR